jgi:6-phosphogluconolactonase
MNRPARMLAVLKKGKKIVRHTSVLSLLIAILFGVLVACGGGSNSSSNGSGGSGGGNPPLPPPLPAGADLLYVGDDGGKVFGFSVDPNSGDPSLVTSLVQGISFTNASSAADVTVAADPGGMVLYATSAGIGGANAASFLVDQKTGTLTLSSQVTLPVPPRKIATFAGKVYIIPDPGANAAELFELSVDGFTGALSAPNQPIALPGVPRDLTISPSGTWIGITFEGASGGEIARLSLEPHSGTLAVLGTTSTGGDSAQGIRVTPDGKFVVVVNQGTSNVSMFSLDSATGALTAVSGSPFSTGDSPIAANPAQVAIAPAGGFVFAGNAGAGGSGSISTYSINASGALTPVAGSPVALGTPSEGTGSLAVDPLGKFVYISTIPKQLEAFALTQGTGALIPIDGSPFNAVIRSMAFIPSVG